MQYHIIMDLNNNEILKSERRTKEANPNLVNYNCFGPRLSDFVDCAVTPNANFINRHVSEENRDSQHDSIQRIINDNVHKYEYIVAKELMDDLINNGHDVSELFHNMKEYRTHPGYNFTNREKQYFKNKINEMHKENPDVDTNVLMDMLNDKYNKNFDRTKNATNRLSDVLILDPEFKRGDWGEFENSDDGAESINDKYNNSSDDENKEKFSDADFINAMNRGC